jgi:uncharacterized protein YjbI with pentapeptide repeats
VAPAFAASADFAIDKRAGQPCPNLADDFRCRVHDHLRDDGFPGCVAYDCFGAGQHVTQHTFRGRSWRDGAAVASEMFDAFAAMRDLHELLWYLEDALALGDAAALHPELRDARDRIGALTDLPAPELVQVDRRGQRARVHELLLRVSAAVRGPTPRGLDLAGRDLLGRDLRDRDLRRAQLAGACLIGADLAGADLRGADLRGADTRGARLGGADLSGALFLVAAQVEAATGDTTTRLPATLARPAHWGRART